MNSLARLRPAIVPRSEWGGHLPVRGDLAAEEVRYLIVHHTAQPDSNYNANDVPRLLSGIYNYHTGANKGWPDVAYNFFVDKFGTIYEGRTGSLERALQGSATGGNQGFSQLCCFLGDFNAAPPPSVAVDSMISLLAWLAERHKIDTTPGATVSFTSRGSNKWPAGQTVMASTICLHRDMSQTECPGNATSELVQATFQARVSAVRGTATPTTVETTAAPTTTTTTTTSTTTTSTTTSPPTTAPSTTTSAPSPEAAKAAPDTVSVDEAGSSLPWEAATVIGLGAAGALGWIIGRRDTLRGPNRPPHD